MKYITLITLLLFMNQAQADIMDGFDSLGGNDALLEKAASVNPELKIKIVQKRIVDRNYKSEFYPEYGTVFGGDAYLDTQFAGLNYQFHINPKWSVGLKYSYFFNELTDEGKELLRERGERQAEVPELDWLKQSYVAQINWYPIYGKFNFFDKGIVHFDGYLILGAGQVSLRNGSSPTYTGGFGMGMWISQHITARAEFRYQAYEAKWYTGTQNIDLTTASLSLGYLL